MRFAQLIAGALALEGAAVVAKPVSSSSPTEQRVEERDVPSKPAAKHLRPYYERVAKRAYVADPSALGNPETNVPGYVDGLSTPGQPLGLNGKGGKFSGATNPIVDIENPSNLGQETTDAGIVTNLKWRFADSRVRQVKGGWVREQVVTDLPASKDIAAAQFHLSKGSAREMHWHRTAEWGFVYAGQVGIAAVDENGQNQYEVLNPGDVWYFPKGQAHTTTGVADQNEFLLVFDDGNFDALGNTFNVDDWISHTPKDILAKNFGVNASIFNTVPSPNPYIAAGNATVSDSDVRHPYGALSGNSTYVKRSSEIEPITAPGGGGTIQIFDSKSFPISTTIAAAVVTVKPGALRELHWNPTADEWIYFVQGQARATVFMGGATARTFDFSAGDTAVLPDNSGHYLINTSNDTDLVWVEIFKADRVADVSLSQWLALTPAPIVAQVLNISIDAVKAIKTEKQLIIA